eukprot:6191421-Pleurochrysis_carterae.AAC.3
MHFAFNEQTYLGRLGQPSRCIHMKIGSLKLELPIRSAFGASAKKASGLIFTSMIAASQSMYTAPAERTKVMHNKCSAHARRNCSWLKRAGAPLQ